MTTSRRIKKRLKAKRLEKAKGEIKAWEKGLQEHWHVTVRRLMMAKAPRDKAEWMAYRAIVEGLSGRDDDGAYEEIAGE